MAERSEPNGSDPFGQWLAQARAGSPDALGQALAACQGPLLRAARRLIPAGLKPKADPADLVQETFLKAWTHFDRFHGSSRAELLRWLRRILLPSAYNLRRRYHPGGKRQAAGVPGPASSFRSGYSAGQSPRRQRAWDR